MHHGLDRFWHIYISLATMNNTKAVVHSTLCFPCDVCKQDVITAQHRTRQIKLPIVPILWNIVCAAVFHNT